MAKRSLIFVLGVWLFQQLSFMPSGFWLLALLPLLYSLIRFSNFRVYLFPMLALALGFAWAGCFAAIRLADTLPFAWESQEIQVQGVVASLPQSLENGTRFEFDVEQVLTPQAIVPRHISLSQYAAGFAQSNPAYNKNPHAILASTLPLKTAPQFHAGERWQLLVKLKRPHATINPHGFDFEVWALERNIRATGSLRASGLNKKLANFVWRPSYLIEAAREKIQKKLKRVLGDRAMGGVLQALVIGDESAISQADWQVFLRTGTNHLMSISGLHITMLSGLAFSLVMALWRRSPSLTLQLPARKAAVFAGLIVALTYALIAGFSVPTQRTFYMLLVFAIALWSGRQVLIARVLAYALFVVALLDPWAVLAPGFWLSFGAVAVMAYALGGRLGEPRWLVAAVQTQWAVTLGLLPFLLVMFQQVSLISPIANAFAIPVVSLLVVPFALMGAILPVDSALLLSHWIMVQAMWLLNWLAAMPFSTWQQHAPPAWAFISGVFGVVWMLLPTGFPLRFLAWVFCLPMLLLTPEAPKIGAMQVVVLDVGQGLAVAVKTHSHYLLYDTGPKYNTQSDSGSRIVVPFLRAEGVRRLDGLVVSHDDSDHSGGMASVLKSIPANWLLSSLPNNVTGLQNIKCFAGQQWQWDGVRFEVLSPEFASYANANIKDNNRSCVIRVVSQFGSVLLAGDIEREVELSLASNHPLAIKSDVLIVPHHGSKTSSTANFIDAIHPKLAVFTVGYRNRFGHPKAEILERYAQRNIQSYRSDLDGAVMLDFHHAAGLEVSAWRQQHHRYWQDVHLLQADINARSPLAEITVTR